MLSIIFLICFTIGSFSAAAYLYGDPRYPVIGAALFLCLGLLLAICAALAIRDALGGKDTL